MSTHTISVEAPYYEVHLVKLGEDHPFKYNYRVDSIPMPGDQIDLDENVYTRAAFTVHHRVFVLDATIIVVEKSKLGVGAES